MTRNSTTASTTQPIIETAADLFDNWFDPIEAGLRERVRDFLALMFEGELDEALSRPRYACRGNPGKRAIAMAIDRDHCWEASAKLQSICRGRD
jgi:hypothetical protein